MNTQRLILSKTAMFNLIHVILILRKASDPCEMAFGIPRNFFQGIPRNKGVNFHSKFGLGIPRNSSEFPTITTLVLKT